MDDILDQELVNDKTRELRFRTGKMFSAYESIHWRPETFYEQHQLALHYAKETRILLEVLEDEDVETISDLDRVNDILSSSHENHFEAMYQHSKLREAGEEPFDALYTGPLNEAAEEFFELESEIVKHYQPSEIVLEKKPRKRT